MLGDGLDKPISPQMTSIGWSHNPEVAGSNPAPAMNQRRHSVRSPRPAQPRHVISTHDFQDLAGGRHAPRPAPRQRRSAPPSQQRSSTKDRTSSTIRRVHVQDPRGRLAAAGLVSQFGSFTTTTPSPRGERAEGFERGHSGSRSAVAMRARRPGGLRRPPGRKRCWARELPYARGR